MSGRVVALVSDLMDRSRITAALPDADLVNDEAGTEGAAFVVIDLARHAAAVPDVRRRCPTARIVAYGSHVDEATLEAARAAGADDSSPARASFETQWLPWGARGPGNAQHPIEVESLCPGSWNVLSARRPARVGSRSSVPLATGGRSDCPGVASTRMRSQSPPRSRPAASRQEIGWQSSGRRVVLLSAIQATWLAGATVVGLPLPMRLGSIEEFASQTRTRIANAVPR